MKHHKDRLDESLGERHGAERFHSQSMADHRHESHGMHEALKEEMHRHEAAMGHHQHHLEKHHKRAHDSQHGHDDYRY